MTNDATQPAAADAPADKQALADELDVTLQQIDDAIAAVGNNRSDIEMHLKGSRSSTNSDRVQRLE